MVGRKTYNYVLDKHTVYTGVRAVLLPTNNGLGS
jgi:hypothetical protein